MLIKQSLNPFQQKVFWTAIIVVATLVVFFPTLFNELTNWDDHAYINENPHIKALSLENIRWIFSNPFMGNYHPLTMISMAIDYKINELNPFVFHFTNLLLHTGNAVLVFFVIFALTGRLNVSVIAGLLFGVHTLHVESVSWVSERKDVLYALFYLAALFSYIRFGKKRERKWYWLSICLFVLSLLSKGQAVSLAVTLFLIDYFQGKKLFDQKSLVNKIPYFILAILFGFIAIKAQQGVSATEMVQTDGLQRIFFASYGFLMYIMKLILPVNLSAYYPYPNFAQGASLPVIYYLAPVAVLVFIVVLYFSFKRSKSVFFALSFFLVNIFLVLQLLPVGRAIMADRYAYVPSIGYCFIFGWFIGSTNILKNHRIGYAIATGYMILLGFLTFERTKDWKNSLVLWTDVISKGRSVPIAWYNRGNVHYGVSDYKKAIADYNECLKEDPRYLRAYINRGQAKTKLLDYKGAVSDYDELLGIDSGYVNAYINRAMSKRILRDLNASLHDYNVAIRLKPGQVELYASRGVVKFELKDVAGALADYDKAISLDPANPTGYSERAIIKKNSNDLAGALADYDIAIGLQPTNSDLYNNRGNLKYQRGDMENALKDYSEAIRCNPKEPLGFQNRGAAFYSQKKYSEALADYSAAISLNPKGADLYYTRALIEKELNDIAGARKDYLKAVELNPGYAMTDLKTSLGMASLQGVKLTFDQCFSMGQNFENQGKLTDAMSQYRKAVELKPDYAEGWHSLGTVYGKTGRYGEAINCFNNSMRYKKNYVEAMSDRGIAKAGMGRTNEALEDLAAAIRMNPEFAMAYFNRALVYLNTGKKELACIDLQKAAKLGNMDANVLYQKQCQGR